MSLQNGLQNPRLIVLCFLEHELHISYHIKKIQKTYVVCAIVIHSRFHLLHAGGDEALLSLVTFPIFSIDESEAVNDGDGSKI